MDPISSIIEKRQLLQEEISGEMVSDIGINLIRWMLVKLNHSEIREM